MAVFCRMVCAGAPAEGRELFGKVKSSGFSRHIGIAFPLPFVEFPVAGPPECNGFKRVRNLVGEKVSERALGGNLFAAGADQSIVFNDIEPRRPTQSAEGSQTQFSLLKSLQRGCRSVILDGLLQLLTGSSSVKSSSR